jgi:uncharacterized protein YegP (UPF0339 family)
MGSTLVIYKDKAGEWRWRRKAANGRITAESGEGYHNQGDAINQAEEVADVGDTIRIESGGGVSMEFPYMKED